MSYTIERVNPRPRPRDAVARQRPLGAEAHPGPGQILYSGVPAIYRVQLRIAACMATVAPPCYGAVLQDAHPPDETTNWIRIPGRP